MAFRCSKWNVHILSEHSISAQGLYILYGVLAMIGFDDVEFQSIIKVF